MFDGVVLFASVEITASGVRVGTAVAPAARAGRATSGCQRAPTPLRVITPRRISIAKWYVARITGIPRGRRAIAWRVGSGRARPDRKVRLSISVAISRLDN